MVKLIWDKKVENSNRDIAKYSAKKSNFTKIETLQVEPNLSHYMEKSRNWHNKLYWGDNLNVLGYLMNDFQNKINLIYVDPPFFSGTNYYIKIDESNSEKVHEKVAYNDKWGNNLDQYLEMLYKRIILFKKLLTEDGLLFIHLDWHSSHYIKIILDQIFGRDKFVNNIVWYYYNKYSAGKKALPRAHDDILVYSKSNNHLLNEIRIPRNEPKKQLKRVMVDGVLKYAKDNNGNVIYRTVTDKKIDDVWKIPCLQPASSKWTGYPTQKHHKLLNRIIRLGSNEGDLIADFFCGSGVSLLEAMKLNRRFIGSDISKYSIHLVRKRIRNLLNENNKFIKYPMDIFTILTEDKKELLSKGFFEKKLEITRKK